MVDIHKATQSDLNKIVFTFESTRRDMSYIPKLHTHKENIEYFKSRVEKSSIYIAVSDKKFAGFIDLTPQWINHLYVDKNFQNKGVGKQLITFAKSQSTDKLYLWVFEENQKAIRFYERENFTLVEKRDIDKADNEEDLPDRKYVWMHS
jgi:putative acetyltransferase